jgi:hypothetical protein
MCPWLWRDSLFVSLVTALLFVGRGKAEDPLPFLAALRVKPSASIATGVLKWRETSWTSYDGSYEVGGPDRRAYAFSPDARLLVTSGPGGWTLEFWDAATGKRLDEIGRTVEPSALAFPPDGKTLVSVGTSNRSGNFVILWDVDKRRILRQLDGNVNRNATNLVAVAPDGQTLITTVLRDDEKEVTSLIRFWDVRKGTEIRLVQRSARPHLPRGRDWHEILSLIFSPDGRSLAAVTQDRLLLLEAQTLRERCALDERLPVLPLYDPRKYPVEPLPWPLAFSRDGRTIALGTNDGLVRLWDVISGREYIPLAGHQGRIRCLTFPPDGKTLVSFGEDARVLTWSLDKISLDWLPKRARLEPKEMTALWEALAGDDAFAQHVAIRVLTDAPASALPFLSEHLHKIPPVDAAHVKQLIGDLRKNDYQAARAASIQLKKYGELAIPALQEAAWDRRRDDEAAGRVLARLYELHPSRERLQELAALEVLERIGSTDARRLLTELSEGAADSLLTREAKASLGRLQKEPVALREPTPELLWDELASTDAAKAFAALRALVQRPRVAVPLLRERLKTAATDEKNDDVIRTDRALEILERIGNDEARLALTALRDEAKVSAFKEAVADSLRRLTK